MELHGEGALAQRLFENYSPLSGPEWKSRSLNPLRDLTLKIFLLKDSIGTSPGICGMRIDIINLDKCEERWASFIANHPDLANAHRFHAVEGSPEIRNQAQKMGLISEPFPAYSPEALGCAMSHIALWDSAVSANRTVTVLEDDVILSANFESKASSLIDSLPANWDIILWGWNFDSILLFEMLGGFGPCLATFNQNLLQRNSSKFRSLDYESIAYRLLRAFGAMAYSMSPSGAKALRQICVPICNTSVYFPGLNKWLPNMGIDTAMNFAYTKLNAYVSIPPLAVSPNDHGASTIQIGART